MIWDLRFRIADFEAKALRVDSGIRMWECGMKWNEISGTQIFTDNHGLYFSAEAGGIKF